MKNGRIWLCMGVLLAFLAVPALAREPIGAQTTMGEIRDDPLIRASGVYTYAYTFEQHWDILRGRTLEEAVGSESVEACAAGLNYAAELTAQGVQVTYPVYTPDEIAADPGLECVELYCFPATRPDAPFALVIGGNAIVYSGELRGGISTAWELHQKGYAVFALRHRLGTDAGDNAPLEDVARALCLIRDNAARFGITMDGYALLGHSSGGQIAGVFAKAELGWEKYGLPKPGALILAYPINDFFEAKPLYHLLMDADDLGSRYYYSYSISELVDADYPPTFLWYGENDKTLKLFCSARQGPALIRALEASAVPHEVHVYADAHHGVGLGVGTDAEGWLDDAVAFWESAMQQTA